MLTILNMQRMNSLKPKNKQTNVAQEHLSRVPRAGLCDITVVHGVAATVTSWIKLAKKGREGKRLN